MDGAEFQDMETGSGRLATTVEIERVTRTPATLARIVRAKTKIRETPIPYEVPTPQELPRIDTRALLGFRALR